MPKSFRTTKARIDSSAFSRLMKVAQKADLYETQRQAREDSFERLINLLCDQFEESDR